MSASNYVLHKVELATQAFLRAQVPIGDIDADHIHVGQQSTKKVLQPACVVCYCTSADYESNYSGNCVARLVVRLESDSDRDGGPTPHHTRAEELYNLMSDTTIAASLSSALQFFKVFLVVPQNQSYSIGDPHWITELEYLVHCCGSDIT